MRSPAALRNLSGQLSVATPSPWVWVVNGVDPASALKAPSTRGSLRAEYVKPASLNHELPTAGRPELAFAGRSNAGKSTLVGELLGNPTLVRTSKSAGCTKTINFFALRDSSGVSQSYLVDLPGYGFARQNKRAVRQWTSVVNGYLQGRERSVLQRTFVLVDSRHGLQPGDEHMLSILDCAGVPNQVILTKVDKVSPHGLLKSVEGVCQVVLAHPASLPIVHCVSAHRGLGMAELASTVWDFGGD